MAEKDSCFWTHATNSLFLNLCHCTFVGDGEAKKRAGETIGDDKVILCLEGLDSGNSHQL
jgi:hypothetical protein